MLNHRYDFNKQEDVYRFNHEIDMLAYSQNFAIQGLNLEEAYKNYFSSDKKVFYMAIDIKLNMLHLFTTLRKLNRSFPRDDLETLFNFHRHWVNFITLYRSFFDKYMNIVIYTGYKDNYRDFDSSKSKNRAFKKILLKQPTMYSPTGGFHHFPESFVNWSYDFLNKVNNQYRTAEVHGDGSARKWSFSENDLSKTPVVLVDELINHMTHFIVGITCILVGKDYAKELQNGITEKSI